MPQFTDIAATAIVIMLIVNALFLHKRSKASLPDDYRWFLESPDGAQVFQPHAIPMAESFEISVLSKEGESDSLVFIGFNGSEKLPLTYSITTPAAATAFADLVALAASEALNRSPGEMV